ncbi:unnamed protein product, partial [Amoebophrya sp. A120]
ASSWPPCVAGLSGPGAFYSKPAARQEVGCAWAGGRRGRPHFGAAGVRRRGRMETRCGPLRQGGNVLGLPDVRKRSEAVASALPSPPPGQGSAARLGTHGDGDAHCAGRRWVSETCPVMSFSPPWAAGSRSRWFCWTEGFESPARTSTKPATRLHIPGKSLQRQRMSISMVVRLLLL